MSVLGLGLEDCFITSLPEVYTVSQKVIALDV